MRKIIDAILGAIMQLSIFRRNDRPTVVTHRNNRQEVALLLVHGFGGDTRATWAEFVDILLDDSAIATWDLFGVGYPTSLRLDVPEVWAADPDLALLARELRTTLGLPPFARYRRIGIAAHSMGGLVVQRAILDDETLRGRLSHVFFFGAPSNGLSKARPFVWLKRQLRDMAIGSPFVTSLRSDWNRVFGAGTPFALRVIAGDRDEFVPSSSSLGGFPEIDLAVVPGNHLEIVKPINRGHLSPTLVVDALSGARRALPVVDGARLAVERGRFQEAIATLLPRVADLDNGALASLALALEAVGRATEAIEVLERRYNDGGGLSTTDALGVLAGRLKRRWLTERVAMDFDKARALYWDALQLAEAARNHAQAFYHAINVAFLDLSALPEASDMSPEIRAMAQRALDHCGQAGDSFWRDATEGEALLMCGELDHADQKYREALAKATSPREVDSMYLHAIRVAARVFGRSGVKRIEQIFEVTP